MNITGNIIAKARKRMSLNQLARELSKIAGRTIHRSQVQRWASGKGITTRNLNLLVDYSIQERKTLCIQPLKKLPLTPAP